MDPLSAIGSGAAVLQFIQYASKACRFITTLHEENHDEFYEGIFSDMTRHFFNFSTQFKIQGPIGCTSGPSPNQEVGWL
jgi:hypothetical protein